MTDRPIIFSAPMVRALLDGRKSMTRRLASSPLAKAKPGDRLWVRENWQALSFGDYLPTKSQTEELRFAATDPLADCDKDVRGYPWRPSIHMPRWASRLTLVVTAVRFERLQDISEKDALAEGITSDVVIIDVHCAGGVHTEVTATRYFYDRCDDEGFESSVDAYAALWESLHGAGSWDANPELAVISFRTHRVNIDRMEIAP